MNESEIGSTEVTHGLANIVEKWEFMFRLLQKVINGLLIYK